VYDIFLVESWILPIYAMGASRWGAKARHLTLSCRVIVRGVLVLKSVGVVRGGPHPSPHVMYCIFLS
jgi:hypothetical protein